EGDGGYGGDGEAGVEDGGDRRPGRERAGRARGEADRPGRARAAGLRRAGEGDGRDRRVDRVGERQRRVVQPELEKPAALGPAERPVRAGGSHRVAGGVEDLRRGYVE